MLRLLLVTDGTVTKALEAYFNAAVHIRLIDQQPLARSAANPLGEFGLQAADLMHRVVHLVREDNYAVLAQAQSLIAVNVLPPNLAEGLLAGRMGIGELIRAQGLDTYRQLQGLGISERAGILGVWRRYGICSKNTVLIQVEEWFPWALYAAAS